MAVDCFLKLDGVRGGSTDAKHKDEIELLSFSFAASQSGGTGSGGGGGAGKVQISGLSCTAVTGGPAHSSSSSAPKASTSSRRS